MVSPKINGGDTIKSAGTLRKSGLSATSVKHAKPRKKPYKLADRDGLYLLVQPNGNRFWRMNYRFHGKQKTMAFGRWPEILLSAARQRLAEAINRLREQGLAELYQNPLTLNFIKAIILDEGAIPEGRADLYEKAVTQLRLEQNDRHKASRLAN